MIKTKKKLVVEKDYFNFYLNDEIKSIKLCWSFYDGFKDIEEAINFIENDLAVNKKEYLYLEYDKKFYPVAVLRNGLQIIITKQFIFFRAGNYSYYKKIKTEDFVKKYRKYSFFNTSMGFYSYAWNLSFIYWLERQNVKMPKCFNDNGEPKEFAYTQNFKQAFFFALFDTKINVYELNCLDDFLNMHMPSRSKLWNDGIKEINPFTGEATIISGVYTKQMWRNNKTENEKQKLLNRYY